MIPTSDPPVPPVTDRATWQEQIDALRVREKAHTREGDAIAAARRRLPVVEVDPATQLIGAAGPVPLIDAFAGRAQLFAKYMMWYDAAPAAHQCEGCTKDTTHMRELSYLHSRDVTFAVFCQGPFPQSDRYREFMGWEMPWYSVPETSRDALIAGRHFGMDVFYLRSGDKVYETYWTTGRGNEPMGSSHLILDMTVYGRQEPWEDSPDDWPQGFGINAATMRTAADASHVADRPEGRPIAQWPRVAAGHSDDLVSQGS
jgi:predicted dithiol-disulfide oxidoreductase (DUF899 family)